LDGKGSVSKGTDMEKVPATRFFYKSFKDLLKGKLTAREALIYGIIADFGDNPNGCFISRADIAKRINESEATAERSLQLLIAEGYIKARRQGRKRYLSITNLYQPDTDDSPNLYQPDTNQPTDLYQNQGQSVSKQGVNLYQLDTLLRSNTKISLLRSNTKIQNNGSEYVNTDKQVAKEQTMAERKAGQANRDWWNALADSEKKDLLAQVEAFGTVFDKKLCKPDTDIGLAILRRYATQAPESVIKQPQDA
jgi:DNA-binding transcriptional ArsR family regulator